VGRVEEISEYQFSNARKNLVKTRYFAVRIDEALKPRESGSKSWNGRRIAILDPREMFYQEQAELIAAGVISFVDARYPTKVQQIAAGDRLVFFLASPETSQKLPLPDARFLICGRAYDTLAITSDTAPAGADQCPRHFYLSVSDWPPAWPVLNPDKTRYPGAGIAVLGRGSATPGQ
jgi:hypothetical protein